MMSEDGSRDINQEDSCRILSCNSCRYFYITWDKKHPYGCRAMGIISAKPPSINVLEIEGRDCLSFERENKKISLKKICRMIEGRGKRRIKKLTLLFKR